MRSALACGTGLVVAIAAFVIAQDATPTTQAVSADARIRAVSHAIIMYATENRGRLPPSLGYALAAQHAKPATFVADPLPPQYEEWPVEQRMIWIDESTDLIYLQGWQHFDPRKPAEDSPFLKAGKARTLKKELPLLLARHEDGTVTIAMGDGGIQHYLPTTSPATTRPAVP